jgi:hypothetical protein
VGSGDWVRWSTAINVDVGSKTCRRDKHDAVTVRMSPVVGLNAVLTLLCCVVGAGRREGVGVGVGVGGCWE